MNWRNMKTKEIITKIINEWDPIGLFPMAPEDEYDCEIDKICEFVFSTHDLQVQPLAQKINKIFVEAFGADAYYEDLEQCLVIAQNILLISREELQNE